LLRKAVAVIAPTAVLAAVALAPMSASADKVCSGVKPYQTCHRICIVPQLRGKTVKRARVLLRNHDCALGRVVRLKGTGVAVGRILKSKPRAHTRHPRGTRVRVFVRKS
jgi:hypothetical protein